MANKSDLKRWSFVSFVVVSFYSIGAGMIESMVNYPLWHIIGPSDVWRPYHLALGPKIILYLAIPALLFQLLTNILIIVYKPISLPKWTTWTSLILLIVAIVSSAVVQIPIQGRLDQGYTYELVDRLIQTDLVLRMGVGVIRGILIIYMMNLVFKPFFRANINFQPVSGSEI